MAWISIKAIPNDLAFLKIVSALVINCPSCEEKQVPNGINANGKKKHKTVYNPVSVRNSTFRSRGICGKMFVTILAQIRKPLMSNGTYALLNSGEDVKTKVNSIITSVSLNDPYYDLIVYQKKAEMTDLETLYYYIRNAFAHGAFEVINTKEGRVYKLESAKNGTVKAQMRLKESTLKSYINYSLIKPADVKVLQKTRTKKTK